MSDAENGTRETMNRAWWLTGLAIAGLVLVPAARAEKAPQDPADLEPALRIPVDPLGFSAPSAFYLTYRMSSASLGFFDDDHLLFTFRVGGLLRRLPSDQGDDDDQEIRAVVLDAHTGQVVRQAQWRMHDRAQYMWPWIGGKFLIRVRDRLFLTDDSLNLNPYLSFDTPLRNIQVAPDRSRVVIEQDEPPHPGPSLESSEGPDVPKPVKVEIVTPGSDHALVITDAKGAVHVPLLGDGIADVLEGKQLGTWVARVVPFDGKPRIFAEVKSNCRPTVQPVSAGVVLVIGCYQTDSDRPVLAVTTDGRELWQDRWGSRYVWGWFDFAENGSRFTYESIQVTHPISSFDALDQEDISQQLAGVYDTESGKLVLVRDATPVLSAGQNVALTPDGRRFAILRRGAIEIYDLPPVSSRPKPEKKQDKKK